VMERFLIFIKHHARFLWIIIEWGNGVVFSVLYRAGLLRVLPGVFREFTLEPFTFKRLSSANAGQLWVLINNQDLGDLEFFHPHGHDLESVKKQFNVKAFLMMGVFEGSNLIGYFFLRFFSNRKCFVGRLIDKNYRGRGIGNVMNTIMYQIAWRMNFRCLSTISRNNRLVMQAHSGNSHIRVIKELHDDYMLVEFIRE